MVKDVSTNTIVTNTQTATTKSSPSMATSTDANATSFNQVMAEAVASTNSATAQQTAAGVAIPSVSMLTDADTARSARPSLKEFMDKTGASVEDASEIVYGVIGSNTDTRNWSAIMASTDPVTMARQATGVMYNQTTMAVTRVDVANSTTDQPTVIAKSGNFALSKTVDGDGNVNYQGLGLVDGQGGMLRALSASPTEIQRQAWLFGFDTAPLQQLVEPAKSMSQPLSDAIAQSAATTTPITKIPTAAALSQEAPVPAAASDAKLAEVSQQLTALSAQLKTGGVTNMTQFMTSYNQLQVLMNQMSALQEKTATTTLSA